ncbi:hypothetical protein OCH239_11660 [Roseivivax halodurans JCM 10272]|uniref:Uncharacterized protein n=1 Tax=Roseivivax halodurans JCM 10272 TaxID=1449350 RepID=X7EJA3_9RHOB|nr:hypothetical protein [Roseivivax halodurans]ETX15940.1 hypothetical protein OCH239_11660 [Roseivivax halodurans JCM 10272]
MTRVAPSSLRNSRTERPGFVTDAEPLGIFGLEALIDRLVWRARLGDVSC